MPPYFSIIIPIYNREHFITRAIDSCLNQDFQDYEIIIVDDGSTDGSVRVVKRYIDSRIKLLLHDRNLGVCSARNSGLSVASGAWAVFLDSDDELLPGSLSIIYRRSIEVDENISRLQFMGQTDTGEKSPDPPLKNERWDYITYVKWMENVYGRRQDTTPIIKRDTFKQIKLSDDRSLEGLYHLDFMKQFHAWSFPDIIAIYHQDAENQLTKIDIKRMLNCAKDQAFSEELLFKKHGEILKVNAPRVYRNKMSGLATLFFLSKKRVKGIKYSFLSLSNNLFSFRDWVILLSGILGANAVAWAKYLKSRLS